MKFYRFRQNNSGGFFSCDEDDGIGPLVWIEEVSAEEANYKAQSIGIYFNGVDDDQDCACCCDRWYPAEECDCELEVPKPDKWVFHDHPYVYVHHRNNTITRITQNEG